MNLASTMHQEDTKSLDKIHCFYNVSQLTRIKIFNNGIISFINVTELYTLKIFLNTFLEYTAFIIILKGYTKYKCTMLNNQIMDFILRILCLEF